MYQELFPLLTLLSGFLVGADADLLLHNGKIVTVDPTFSICRAVNPYNPFLGLWICVTRRTVRGDISRPEETITCEEALKMYTTSAAYRHFVETSRESIEPGKVADIVVIDRDYLTCCGDRIKDIQPVMAILDGKVVAD